jgi:hypothetical protein
MSGSHAACTSQPQTVACWFPSARSCITACLPACNQHGTPSGRKYACSHTSDPPRLTLRCGCRTSGSHTAYTSQQKAVACRPSNARSCITACLSACSQHGTPSGAKMRMPTHKRPTQNSPCGADAVGGLQEILTLLKAPWGMRGASYCSTSEPVPKRSCAAKNGCTGHTAKHAPIPTPPVGGGTAGSDRSARPKNSSLTHLCDPNGCTGYNTHKRTQKEIHPTQPSQ